MVNGENVIMQLKCPHGYDVSPIDIIGLIIYKHEKDNSSCVFMNRLDVRPMTILMNNFDTTSFTSDNPQITAMLTSEVSRKHIYNYISGLSGEELAKKLQILIEVFKKSHVVKTHELYQEIVNIFGHSAVINVKLVSGVDLTDQYAARKNVKMIHMDRLNPEDVKYKIKDYMKDFVSNRKQALSDIFPEGTF